MNNMVIENQIYVDDKFYDISNINIFYIDDSGQKHVEKLEDSWQELKCEFSDQLVFDVAWRVKNEADIFSDKKIKAIRQIKEFAASIRSEMTGHADTNEVTGWLKKVPRAERIINGTASEKDIAIQQAECDERGYGETPLELAEKQIKKSDRLDTAIAVVDGMQSAALSAIQSKRNENTLAELLEELKAKATQKLKELKEAENG